MIWRTISSESRVWGIVFLAAMLLVLLGVEGVLSMEGWVLWLTVACLSFATVGLTMQTVRDVVRRRRPEPHREQSEGY